LMISASVDRPLGQLNAVLHSVELGDTETACVLEFASGHESAGHDARRTRDAARRLNAKNLPTEAKARGSDRLKRSQPASPIGRYQLFDVGAFTGLGR